MQFDAVSLDDCEKQCRAVLGEVQAAPLLTPPQLAAVLRRHPLPDGNLFSKNQLIQCYRQLCEREGIQPDVVLVRKLRLKPTRTISGVAPVTVLTRPAPCPGECVFCPSVKAMPKSYLPNEPGALRAAKHDFDPFDQTRSRIKTLAGNGHSVDKIELLILGGTWSSYSEAYRTWFVRRCFDAMNGVESSSLLEAHRLNERAPHRNVGLVIETRPDCVSVDELHHLRHLGVTKVQVGVQSLDDDILAMNHRGHTSDQTRAALRLLRLGGFKIVVHWMPNLLGATLQGDFADFVKLWNDPGIRPDELKIYPTALLHNTRLSEHWRRGTYKPYEESVLVELLARCKAVIPRYCRLNRLMRDIPAPDIIAGVKKSNLRQIVRRHMADHQMNCSCIRCREVRGTRVDLTRLEFSRLDYDTDATSESFLSYVTEDDRIAGFLRLSMPAERPPFAELEGCATIRQVHVYGPAIPLDTRPTDRVQHAGVGTLLIDQARVIARRRGYKRLAVISAVGTRSYYAARGFAPGELYMIASV